MPELTILTVCIERHYDDVRRNVGLMTRLNPDFDWRLVIIDNTSTEPSRLVIDDDRVEVRPGVPLDTGQPADARFSYHHATALNANLGNLRSRFLLVIDPDLYVIYPNWMRESTAHMQEQGVSFFGTPWHPRWYTKYRNFPCVHCMLIDLQHVPAERLDFRPELTERPSWSKRRLEALGGNDVDPREAIAGAPPRHPPSVLREIGWRLLDMTYRAGYPILSRQLIGSSRDTGWKVWAEFGRSGRHRIELVLPIVDIEADFVRPAFLAGKFGRLLDGAFPAKFRFLPQPGTYVAPGVMRGFESVDFHALAAERFVWRGQPFAFHLRRHITDRSDRAEDRAAEATVLARILKQAAD